jgi:uncharacterized glyoxalase superfamily protein PhnB
MRWLSVRVPGDNDRVIMLELPGPPAHDPATADTVRQLVAKGAGGWLAFQVTDVDAVHAELVAKGVDITDPPTNRDYGRDFGARDPFGNRLRFGNVTA